MKKSFLWVTAGLVLIIASLAASRPCRSAP